jgi:hypothetical protein
MFKQQVRQEVEKDLNGWGGKRRRLSTLVLRSHFTGNWCGILALRFPLTGSNGVLLLGCRLRRQGLPIFV